MIEGVRVIDFHGHVGSNDIMGMVDDPDLMLHAMDACGIDVSCLFNIYYPSGPNGNDMTAQFVARHPDRFVGFAYVSPLTPAAAMVARVGKGNRHPEAGGDQALSPLRSLVSREAPVGSHLRVR